MSHTPNSPFDRTSEVNLILDEDSTLIGNIWRELVSGKSTSEISTAVGSDIPNVNTYLRLIKALQDGEVPTAPSVAQGHLGRVRKWLRSKALSPQLRTELELQQVALEAAAENQITREMETQAATEITEVVESRGVPGIYVYTLPHYLLHPYDTQSGRTLLKVGHSSRDTLGRFSGQTRVTALPEDPILLRVYPADETAKVEREFHSWLLDAGHPRPSTRRGGTEWFVTSTSFLDRVARSLGLEIQIVNSDATLGEG